ncbi:hypothetical protein AB0K40_20000 [Nonomuraea bangladeshensis]|uniref:Uncharacterized protein n=1 Tax=Nonomuraea bangladeshensis TaxID=404385 RepID=A0ABV3H5J2_9ACTN
MWPVRVRRVMMFAMSGVTAGALLGVGGAAIVRRLDQKAVPEAGTPYNGHRLRGAESLSPRAWVAPITLPPTRLVGDPPLPGALTPGPTTLPYKISRHPDLGFQTEVSASRRVRQDSGWIRYQDVAWPDRPYVDLTVTFHPQALDTALVATRRRHLFLRNEGYREMRWVIGSGGRFGGKWAVLEGAVGVNAVYPQEGSLDPDTDLERWYTLYFDDGRGAGYEILATYQPQFATRAAEEVGHLLWAFTLIGVKAPSRLPAS